MENIGLFWAISYLPKEACTRCICVPRNTRAQKKPIILSKQPKSGLYSVTKAILPPKETCMGWLRLVGSLKSQVSFAKEPYIRDDILQKRPIF